jgi:hypothetical protein
MSPLVARFWRAWRRSRRSPVECHGMPRRGSAAGFCDGVEPALDVIDGNQVGLVAVFHLGAQLLTVACSRRSCVCALLDDLDLRVHLFLHAAEPGLHPPPPRSGRGG